VRRGSGGSARDRGPALERRRFRSRARVHILREELPPRADGPARQLPPAGPEVSRSGGAFGKKPKHSAGRVPRPSVGILNGCCVSRHDLLRRSSWLAAPQTYLGFAMLALQLMLARSPAFP